jgi:glycogen synthase
MASRISASVVINTYNRANTLPDTLKAMSWLRYPAFEVIVVNGPSTDATEDVLAQYRGSIRVGHCPETNLSMSRNIGISLARGEVVAFIDDDGVPEPDWLDALCARYGDPRVGGVGGLIRDHTGYTFQSRVTACDRFGDAAGYDTPEGALASGASKTGAGCRTFLSPTGCNSSFRRAALEQVGGFDEEFAYFLDETDVAIRIIEKGWRIEYALDAEVHHKFASSHLRSANRIPRNLYLPARSKTYFCARHAASHGIKEVFKHLINYRIEQKGHMKYYLKHNIIQNSHYDRLIDDIERGTRDGMLDAFRYPQGRLASLPPAREKISPYPIKRPSAGRLRLCFLSQEYPPGAVGGIAVWTHQLAAALADRGHEISVVTRTDGHPRVDFEEGVWVHRIPRLHYPSRRAPGLPDLPPSIADWCFTALDEVLRIRARRGLDLVSAPIWDVEGAACLVSGQIPTVTSLHSTYKLVLPSKREWQENSKIRTLHVEKMIAAERWILDRPDFVLANSRAIVRDIEAEYGLALNSGKVRVIPHGVSLETVDPAPERDPLCRILFVGRFETRKGIGILAQAIPQVLHACPEARFVLAGNPDIHEGGSGPTYREQIETLAAQFGARVQMLGVLPREELVAEYARADIFTAPSRYESFGLIFLEAMMHGAACVGTNVGGIPEVVEHGVTGLLAPPDDPASLAAALIQLVNDPALRQRLGEAGLAAFRERFTVARMAETVEREYGAFIEECAVQELTRVSRRIAR